MHRKFLFLFLLAFSTIFGCTEKILDTTSPETQAAAETNEPDLKSGGMTYYVAKTGNDANSGTSEAPFLTIQKAANTVQPGDVVIIRDGVYSSSSEYFIQINKGGSSGNYVVFKSENKWGAVLDGGNSSGYGITIGNGASYIKFVDLEIKNFLWMGIFNNNKTNPSSYITIQGCKIRDIGRVFDTGNIGRCGIYWSKGNHHWTVTQNLIYNIGRTNETDSYRLNKDHAVYIGTAGSKSEASHDNVISYNIMYSVSGNTLNVGSYGDLITNNVSAWPNRNLAGGSCFIVTEGAGGTDLTITNNIIYGLDPKFNFAIQSWTGYSGWVVKNNIISGGRMWATAKSGASAMAGNNYGQTDCEKGEIDPKFVSGNLPNVDFSLQPSSPAVDNGVDVGLSSDYFGKAISGLPNIGAIE